VHSTAAHVPCTAAQKAQGVPGGLPCLLSINRRLLCGTHTTTCLVAEGYHRKTKLELVFHTHFYDKVNAMCSSTADAANVMFQTTATSLPTFEPIGTGDITEGFIGSQTSAAPAICTTYNNLPSEDGFHLQKEDGGALSGTAAVAASTRVI
jgi:hypothetical protein